MGALAVGETDWNPYRPDTSPASVHVQRLLIRLSMRPLQAHHVSSVSMPHNGQVRCSDLVAPVLHRPRHRPALNSQAVHHRLMPFSSSFWGHGHPVATQRSTTAGDRPISMYLHLIAPSVSRRPVVFVHRMLKHRQRDMQVATTALHTDSPALGGKDHPFSRHR